MNIPLHFGNKHYFSFKQWMSQRFNFPVNKLSVDAGFICPNRDGRIGDNGCTYCYNPNFSLAVYHNHASNSIQEQIKRLMLKSKKKGKFLVYFQPYTNTYGSPERLRSLYDIALQDENVIGLCIGTRPDCVDNEILSLIEEYAKNYHIWLEYGLQSIHDHTLKRINRGHSFAQFEDAINRTRGRGIFICVHIILGLPGETREDMIKTVKMLSKMGIDGIKIHHLQVIKDTPMAEEFYQGRVKVFTPEEFIPLVCDVLEYLSPEIAVQRLFGEVLDEKLLIAPCWIKPKNEIFVAIEAEFLKRGSFQGEKSL
ncbi:MAG: TIGR01212 family radical SAM protein [Candidatus Desantisbacteria bacterium]